MQALSLEERAEPQPDSKNHPELGDMEPIGLVSTAVSASHRVIGGSDLAGIDPPHRGNRQRLENGRSRFSEECVGEDAGEIRLEDSFTYRSRQQLSHRLSQNELGLVPPPLLFRQGEG